MDIPLSKYQRFLTLKAKADKYYADLSAFMMLGDFALQARRQDIESRYFGLNSEQVIMLQRIELSVLSNYIQTFFTDTDSGTPPPPVGTAPKNIFLSATSIVEGNDINDFVALISADVTDATFSLVSGTGSTDNEDFLIVGGDQLRGATIFDADTQSAHSIRIRAQNAYGHTEKTFVINVVTGTSVDPRAIGYVLATDAPYNADPTGVDDSSNGLIAAWKAAGEQAKCLLVPSGTYRVTKTVYLYAYKNKRGGSGDPHDPLGVPMVGEDVGGEKTKIVLDDNSTGFGNGNVRRAVLDNRVFHRDENDVESPGFDGPLPANVDSAPDGWNAQGRDKNYKGYFLNLEVDCGSNNPGAVGICFEGAEETFIADCIVRGNGHYCCYYGIPGTGGGLNNCASIGGRYGILNRDSAGSQIIGHTFSGHTVAAFTAASFGMNIIIGFNATLPVGAKMSAMHSSSSQPARGTMAFIDGVITSGGGVNALFDNGNNKNFYIENVYVTGTNNLVKSGSKATITQTGTWKRIIEYSNTDSVTASAPYAQNTNVFSSFSMIDGTVRSAGQLPEPVIDIELVASELVPSNLRQKHIWAAPHPISGMPYYTGQSDGTIVTSMAPYNVVLDDSSKGLQNRNGLQAAIDKAYNDGTLKVFIPPGTSEDSKLYLRGDIDHKPGVQIFTSMAGYVNVTPDQTWINQVKANPQKTYIFKTSGPANAASYAGLLSFRLPSGGGSSSSPPNEQWFSAYEWTVGRNSMSFMLGVAGWTQFYSQQNRPTTNPGSSITFTGNGGGRHYSGTGNNIGNSAIKMGSNYSVVEIDSTDEPLVFYGVIVPANEVDHMFEIRNSQNVMILGISTEEGKRYIDIIDSENIAVIGCSRNRSQGSNSAHRVNVLGSSDNILAAVLTVQSFHGNTGQTSNFPAMVKVGSNRIDYPYQVCIAKEGNFSWTPFTHDYLPA